MLQHPNSQPSNGQDELNVEPIQVYVPTKKSPSRNQFSLLDHQRKLTVWGHIVLSTCLLGSFLLGDVTTAHFAAQKQRKWLAVPDPRTKVVLLSEHLYYYDPNELIKKLLGEYQSTNKTLTVQQKEVLRIYYLYIAARTFVHADVLSYCYIRMIVTITLVTMSALLASLCLFFISREGWEKASNILINIFFICAGIVVVYGGLAVGLNYEENIKENQKMYAAYNNLQNETLRFLATGLLRDGESATASQYILYLDTKMEELSAVALDLNAKDVLRYRENIMKTIDSKAQVGSK